MMGDASGGNVGQMFAAQARRHAHDTALCGDGHCLTYGELNDRVNRLGNALHNRGVARGDRIAILARNCPAFVEIELAAAKTGAILASLNWRLSPAEIRHCLELTDPKLVFVQPGYRDHLADIDCVVIDETYDSLLAGAAATEPPSEACGEDGLVIIFTSGTTGLPKGALISHRAIIARAAIFGAETGAPPQGTFVAWTPLFHMGANDFTLATLIRGGKVITVDGYQPSALMQAVARERIHYFPVIPGMIAPFISELVNHDIRPKGIGMIGAMADLVPPHQLAEITRLLDAPYLNTFGSTETGMPPASASYIPIGTAPTVLSKRQNDLCEVRLVDANDNDVPDGEPGEVAIRGLSLFSGYWNNPAANAEAFRGGWFHMGDVMRRNPDGTLDFVDRLKYMIKSGGENIYPAEIERHILADPRVGTAAVVRKADARWGEVPVVFIARCNSHPDAAALTSEAVIDRCRGKLARYKLPKEVHFIADSEFPRNVTGKIMRHELEARLNR